MGRGNGGTHVAQDVLVVAVYRCPGCDAELEAPEAADTGWVRCPRCGKFDFEKPHTCPPLWGAKVAGSEDDWELVYAYDAEAAAEKFS